MADDVQPTGEGDGGDQLYDLSSVPENLREHVEPVLKEIQASVTPRFQEAAEYRKSWAPYQDLGVQDVPPQQLQELLEFAKMTQDREQMVAWLKEVAPQFDLQFADEEDEFDADELDSEGVLERVEKLLDDRLGPVQETLQSEQQARSTQEAMQTINSSMDAIEKEHGEFNREIVARLAEQYAADDPQNCIQRGYEDYQAIRGEGEKGLFEQKSNQPSTPEGAGGAADTTPPPVRSIEEAGKRLRERLGANEAV